MSMTISPQTRLSESSPSSRTTLLFVGESFTLLAARLRLALPQPTVEFARVGNFDTSSPAQHRVNKGVTIHLFEVSAKAYSLVLETTQAPDDHSPAIRRAGVLLDYRPYFQAVCIAVDTLIYVC